jgi:hypothetical protein
MAGKHTIQSVGGQTVTIQHPLVAGGAAISLKGFKLEENFLDSNQLIDNVKRVVLSNGDTAALTNNITAGDLTINAVRVSDNYLDGDVILIAQMLQQLGDSVGGVIRITIPMDGKVISITYWGVVVKSVPSVKLAGNDVVTYPVVLSYGGFSNS